MSFLRIFWSLPLKRIILLILGSLLTLWVLWWAWMDYSGATRWTAAQTMVQKEGETFDFRAVTLPPVPEEKNFCAIPALKDLALVVDHDPEKGEPAAKRKRLKDTVLPDGKKEPAVPRPQLAPGPSYGTPTNLKAWADWLRKESPAPVPPAAGDAAREVLAALSKDDALFAELAAGLSRPEAHWTPEWKTRELPEMLFSVPIPHYQAANYLVTTLTLRATAAARAGDATTAHQSLLMALRLARASLNDPLLIGTLVACSNAAQIYGAVWEVCDAHCGSAEDFRRLEHEVAQLNFEAGMLRAFRGELASSTSMVMWMKRTCDPSVFGSAQGEGNPPWYARLLLKVIPGGLFDMNAATIAELEYSYVIKPLRDEGLPGCLRQAEALEDTVKERKEHYHLDGIFANLMMTTVLSVQSRMAYTQCETDEALAACALEQWFSEHHEYPDSVETLKDENGKPLAMDALTHRPMGYRKTSDGKYALWCAGFDGKDDGGKRVLNEKNPDHTKFSDRAYKGDWVWSYEP